MKAITRYACFLLILLSSFLGACRKDLQVIPEELVGILPADPSRQLQGFYLVNEGNMGMNKASLDYMDFSTGVYRRNMYNQMNPAQVNGLGDVANDVGIYGSKLYVVVNISNKVEVMDAKSGKRIQQINVTNPRYITFKDGKAYVSAYLGQVGVPDAPNGVVVQIDTASLKEEKRIEVGRQPEEMAVVGQKLYVANSGGYTPLNYDTRVSVIDLNSFSVVKNIDVAINLHRLKADKYGDIYVTSRGNYLDIHSKIYVIDTKTDLIKTRFDIGASNLVIDDDIAYFYGSEWSSNTGKFSLSYGMLDVKQEKILNTKFITDGTDAKIMIPYGIAVDKYTKEVFVTDARDYVSPGVLYCFDPAGKKKWSVVTGDIPAHFAMVYK
ncbi:YncE family protein [Pedobacter sp. LMG 31462]|uniref:YncE family protein n=2 Tax=Pedobacter gandavensis TaxID=2679963 RepID=A0ABR6ET52_9SPHI|nr:YncE family protein [Pedobacter gandavensis]